NVRSNLAGYIEGDIIGKSDILPLRFLSDDSDLRFQVGWLNIRNQTPFEPGVKPFFQRWYFAWRAIRRNDDLLMRIIKRIEGMKELFLSTFFPSNELNVINQKNVVVSIPLLEAEHFVVSNGIDDFICELLRGDIGETKLFIVQFDHVPDGVH